MSPHVIMFMTRIHLFTNPHFPPTASAPRSDSGATDGTSQHLFSGAQRGVAEPAGSWSHGWDRKLTRKQLIMPHQP